MTRIQNVKKTNFENFVQKFQNFDLKINLTKKYVAASEAGFLTKFILKPLEPTSLFRHCGG